MTKVTTMSLTSTVSTLSAIVPSTHAVMSSPLPFSLSRSNEYSIQTDSNGRAVIDSINVLILNATINLAKTKCYSTVGY